MTPRAKARAEDDRDRRLVSPWARLMLGLVLAALAYGLVTRATPVPTARAAAAPDPARLRLAAALLDGVVRDLLPIDIVLPSGAGSADGGVGGSPIAAAISELRYCGVTDKGVGRFRAVIRWGRLGTGGPPLLEGADHCQQPLADLVRRQARAETDDGVVAADLEGSWRPWELRLLVVRLSGPSPPRPGDPRPLAGLDGRRELLVVSTSSLHVATGDGDTLTFHAVPVFGADAVDLWAGWGEGAATSAAARAAGGLPGLPAGVNLTLDLPHALANQILRRLTGDQHSLTVPVDRDTVDVQNVAIGGAGAGSAMSVSGLATPRSVRETVRLTVQAAGDEMKVGTVRADAQLESCAGLGALAAVGCNARNAARAAAAAAFGAAMTQRYQGQLVRDLAGERELSLDLGSRRLGLRGSLAHVAASPRGLSLAGRFSSASEVR